MPGGPCYAVSAGPSDRTVIQTPTQGWRPGLLICRAYGANERPDDSAASGLSPNSEVPAADRAALQANSSDPDLGKERAVKLPVHARDVQNRYLLGAFHLACFRIAAVAESFAVHLLRYTVVTRVYRSFCPSLSRGT